MDTSKVYGADDGTGGRFFTGLGVEFVRWPRTMQLLEFRNGGNSSAITAKTTEGVDVELQASMQYRLRREPDQLASLFAKYGYNPDHNAFFITYVRSVVRDVISQYRVQDMWQQRAAIVDATRTAVENKLAENHAVVVGWQLLNLEIPSNLQAAIEVTTQEQQKIEQSRESLAAVRVEADTQLQESTKLAEATVIDADATAKSIVFDAIAKASALNYTVQAEGDALDAVKDTLNFNNTELLTYVWLDAVQKGQASKRVVALHQPSSTKSV